MPNTNMVVRHSRHEFVKHDGEATAEILAGQSVVENGDGTVSPGTDGSDRLLIAQEDRDSRGMEIGDAYAAGEYLYYLACSGGGVHVLTAPGTTIDPATENRIVVNADGYFVPIDTAGGDVEADIVGYAVDDEVVDAPADEAAHFAMEVA